MYSEKIYYLLALSIAALVFSLLFQMWVLSVLFIAPISLIAVGHLFLPSEGERIEIERNSSHGNIYREEETEVELTVKNRGEECFIELWDELEPEIDITEGSNHHLVHLEEGEERSITYTMSSSVPGDYRLGPVKLRQKDPLGIFNEEWVNGAQEEVSVLPRKEEMSRSEVRPTQTRNSLGNIKSKGMGIGTEFYSISEYHPGDEMRNINWKATARQLKPMTNEFVGERSGDIIIILDALKSSEVGSSKNNTLNPSIRAAVSLASDMISDRNRVGLIVLGEFIDWLYPGYGREQMFRIMDELKDFERGGMWRLEETKWVLKRFFPGNCLIVFISPLTKRRMVDVLIDLYRRRYEITVVSPSPLAVERKVHGRIDPLAREIHSMERQNIIDNLRQYGRVVDWDPNQPLEASIEEVKRYWRRR